MFVKLLILGSEDLTCEDFETWLHVQDGKSDFWGWKRKKGNFLFGFFFFFLRRCLFMGFACCDLCAVLIFCLFWGSISSVKEKKKFLSLSQMSLSVVSFAYHTFFTPRESWMSSFPRYINGKRPAVQNQD